MERHAAMEDEHSRPGDAEELLKNDARSFARGTQALQLQTKRHILFGADCSGNRRQLVKCMSIGKEVVATASFYIGTAIVRLLPFHTFKQHISHFYHYKQRVYIQKGSQSCRPNLRQNCWTLTWTAMSTHGYPIIV
jgi:hypothetical protein